MWKNRIREVVILKREFGNPMIKGIYYNKVGKVPNLDARIFVYICESMYRKLLGKKLFTLYSFHLSSST